MDPAVCFDPAMANAAMMGRNELIIDMQSHFATPETNPIGAFGLDCSSARSTTTRFPWIERSAGRDRARASYDRTEYINQILMGSDTTIGVLSGISYRSARTGPWARGFAVLTNEDLLDGAEYLATQFPGRMLTHCMVMPNDRIGRAARDDGAERQLAITTGRPIRPGAGAGTGGYWLNEGVGPMMIQKGLDLKLADLLHPQGLPAQRLQPELHATRRTWARRPACSPDSALRDLPLGVRSTAWRPASRASPERRGPWPTAAGIARAAASGPRVRTTETDAAVHDDVPARPRRQQPDQVAARQQHRAQRHEPRSEHEAGHARDRELDPRVCRVRRRLADPDDRSRRRGDALLGQAAQAHRRGPHRLGHRLLVVRLAGTR